MIGRLIDGRYQVRSRIARGGMATVYLASDLRLERPVAVKIMHGHLADDENFKERFIQEARSAARLAHPNVVNVYDQGQDDESAYIVMEYLPGITLRELLQEHKVLTPEQATDILEAVLAGLAAAHRSGIVHRDLKPENVLLADDGRIKIGDFGLARAASANTATGAALLGTIAYLSPELVTRGIADTRSDIYALGIMLFEMLTGEQPYKGEQPMQIAYQHANDTVPMPSSVNPAVPAELDELVLWATARDPDQRPRDARQMLEHLYDLQRGLAEPGARAVNKTMVMPAAMAPVPPAPGHSSLGPTGETQVLQKARHRTGPVTPAGSSSNADALSRKATARRKRGAILLVIVIAVALLVGGIAWWIGPGPGGKATVPGIANASVAAATSQLKEAGFQVSPTQVKTFSPVIKAGQVTATQPKSGSSVKKGSSVALVVSQGPRMLDFPKVVGQQEAAAKASLAHFTVKPSSYQFDDQAKGIVLAVTGVNAQGASTDLGSTTKYGEQQPVTLTVSLGPVPNVDGKSLADAQAALTAVQLKGTETSSAYSDTVPSGAVISSSAAVSGPVKAGATINLVVSKGPPPITIPNEVGKTIANAEKDLTALGLKVTYKKCSPAAVCDAFNWKNFLTVASMDPAASATAYKGDTVTLKYNTIGIG
jgi:beta-lactam-binding protein with PASTA domain/predicted Ser/Thr protein kinase